MEFGALWVREWRDDITHLIADKSIPYNDILRFLKISSLPVGSLVGSVQAHLLNIIARRHPRQRCIPLRLPHIRIPSESESAILSSKRSRGHLNHSGLIEPCNFIRHLAAAQT